MNLLNLIQCYDACTKLNLVDSAKELRDLIDRIVLDTKAEYEAKNSTQAGTEAD